MISTNLSLLLSLLSLPAAMSDLLDSPASSQCTETHISSAVGSIQVCKPRPVIVRIPWPNNTNVHQMTPTHVEVNRCAGSCHRTGQSCLASRVGEREVAVLLGECGISPGRCDKLCSTISVREDLECQCGCHLSRVKCEAALHRLNEDICRCECRNVADKQSCLDRGEVWEEENCRCSSGNSKTSYQILDWQIVIIFVLGLCIVLMVLVIVILIRKVIRMRKKIRIQESIRNIQNIDSFYEFMTKKTSPSENKYETVYTVSQSESSESSEETQESYCDKEEGVNTITMVTKEEGVNTITSPISYRHHVNTQPIDEALLLLKLSTDRL